MAGRYSMADARFNLEKIHSVEGVFVRNAYDNAMVRGVDLGLLYLPSGQIIMADPERKHALADLSRKTFSESVPAGNYPVTVYMVKTETDERIGFAEVRFNHNLPIKYVKAISMYDSENMRRGPCGYIVHDCQTGIMDAEVFKINSNNPKRTNWHSIVDFDSWDESEEKENQPYSIGFSPDGQLNALRLEVQSGCYYWYWGKDKAGNICCLIADFFTYV